MKVWLTGIERGRLSEKLREFAQTAEESTELFEVMAAGVRVLEELLGADRVGVWTLSQRGSFLRWCAGTTSEWLGTELELALYPRLAELLRTSRPQWVELATDVWSELPAPLLGAYSFLFLPVSWQRQVRGCVFVILDHLRSAPAPKEVAECQLVAALLSGAWYMSEAERLGEEQREKWSNLLRAAQELAQSPGERRGLEALLDATIAAIPLESLAVYECGEESWQRLAAAGPAELVPAMLPMGAPDIWPWEKASATRASVLLPEQDEAVRFPPQVQAVCAAWEASACSLWVLPLPSPRHQRVLLAVVPPAGPRWLGAVLEVWTGFVGMMLAAAELPEAAAGVEERWQQVLESLPIPAFGLDTAGRIVLLNRPLLEWTGASARELLGQPWIAYLDEPGRKAYAAWPGEADGAWHQDLRWLTRTGPKLCQVVVRRFDLRSNLTFVGFLLDLAQTDRLEQERQQAEARLKGILDSIHDGVWLIGIDGSVQLVNYRLAHLLGVDPREIGPRMKQASLIEQLKGRFQDPERVAARWLYLNAHPEEVSWDELELLQPRRRILERFVRPVHDAAQRLVGRLEIYREVTTERQLEHTMIHRERLAALGQSISGVAHELNNPLTAVAGYAQLLQRHPLPPEAQEELARLTREAERAGRIARNLLLLARPGKSERQRVCLRDVVERILEFRLYELKVNNITLKRDYQNNVPDVWANPHALEQVFLNLLLNAEQAIRSVRVRGTILIRILHLFPPDRVRVEVIDDGPGIPPEELPHVFEPFFTTKQPQEGTGLGLTVSRAIIKEHEGEIFAEKRPGGGAVFAVELLAVPAAQKVEPRQIEPRPVAEATTARPRILVVDDERTVAQLITDVLQQQGYEVELYADSSQALEQALSRPFDLVICDIKMPEVDGEAFHRRLRERGHPLATRILFTTGDTLARSTAQFLDRVGLPCLAKPFLVDELKVAVRDLLAAPPGRQVSGL